MSWLSIVARLTVFFGLLFVVLFLAAGRIDLPFFWAYLGTFFVMAVVVVRVTGRELMAERIRPAPGGRDQLLRVLSIPAMLGHFVVAGLDVGRYHWSDTAPATLQVAALAVIILGLSVWGWAIRENRFFSSVIKIQERHRVVDTGPYRFVRHPGYAAAMVLYLASGIALGSWWSMVPACGLVFLMLRRTWLEDRILRQELPGYPEYAARVRYRLLRGVW